MGGDSRYLDKTEGSGGNEDGSRQGRVSDGMPMAKAGYKTISMADRPEDGQMTELADPFTEKAM